nr:hypothetical protein [Tanacetum cinerariifolium]
MLILVKGDESSLYFEVNREHTLLTSAAWRGNRTYCDVRCEINVSYNFYNFVVVYTSGWKEANAAVFVARQSFI